MWKNSIANEPWEARTVKTLRKRKFWIWAGCLTRSGAKKVSQMGWLHFVDKAL